MTEQSNTIPGYLARFSAIAHALEGAARAMANLEPNEYELVLACLTSQTSPALELIGRPGAEVESAEEATDEVQPKGKGKRAPKVVERPEGKRAPRGEWKRLVSEELNNRGLGGTIGTAEIGKLIGCSSAVASQRASMLAKLGVLQRAERGSYEIRLLSIPEGAGEELQANEGGEA